MVGQAAQVVGQGETFHRRTTTTDDNARLDIRARGFWDNNAENTFLMSIFSIPMHHQTGQPQQPLATDDMKEPNATSMKKEKLKRLHSHPLFSTRLEEPVH